MNVTVTILQNGRCDDYGIPLVAGSSYSLDYDRAKSLWQAGFASVTDPNVFDDENTGVAGSFVRQSKFVGFKRCLLASLVANSTASRSNGLVTIAATGHGITTGATYQGYRFYYPGSPSLAAGWYDSIVTIADANTLTFSAPGADFGSQSVNGAAFYSTLTVMAGNLVIPGGTLKEGGSISVLMFRGGSTDAGQKISRMRYGGSVLGAYVATTVPNTAARHTMLCAAPNKQVGCNGVDSIVSNSRYEGTINQDVDQVLDLTLQLSATASFMTMDAIHVEFAT